MFGADYGNSMAVDAQAVPSVTMSLAVMLIIQDMRVIAFYEDRFRLPTPS